MSAGAYSENGLALLFIQLILIYISVVLTSWYSEWKKIRGRK